MNDTYRLVKAINVLLLLLLVSACTSTQEDEQDISKYVAFLQKEVPAYYLGRNPNLIHRLDSYYAAQKNVPPYARLLLDADKANYYFNQGKFDSANLVNEDALSILKNRKQDKRYYQVYADRIDFKGQVLYAIGNYSEAYNSYYQAKQAAEHLNDSCIMGMYAYRLGMLSYKQKKYATGVGYFKQAVRIALQCKDEDPYKTQEEIDNIGLCYERAHMPDSAVYYYDSAITFLSHKGSGIKYEGGLDKALAVVYGNIGSALFSEGLTDSAIGMLQKSYAINIRPYYDNGDALLVHIKLTRAYLAKNAMDMVKQSLTSLRQELDTIRHQLDAESAWEQLLYEYYDKTGDLNEAFKHYKTYGTIKDSLWEAERLQTESDAVRAMSEKEQSYKLAMLKEANDENGTYLWVAVVFLVMTLVIVVLVFFYYRKGQRNIKELTKLKTELEEADEERDKIMNIVVHDLRGPVSGVYTVTDMMLTEGDRSPEDIEMINMIKTATESGLALINQLMVYKKESREAIVKAPNDIVKIVEDDIKLLQLRANEKGITLNKHLPAGPVVMAVDKEKINRVINNLISNAIKFSNTGSSVDIIVETREMDVRITVRDTGIGIPEKLQKDVFSMFTSAKRSGTEGETSFGLGLSITKQIVEAHGGKIWLESEEGKGTAFYVELPR